MARSLKDVYRHLQLSDSIADVLELELELVASVLRFVASQTVSELA